MKRALRKLQRQDIKERKRLKEGNTMEYNIKKSELKAHLEKMIEDKKKTQQIYIPLNREWDIITGEIKAMENIINWWC